MKATDILMEEHRLIERVLASLEAATHRLQEEKPASAEFFLTTADFISGFADGCHHRKEEGVLFPAMEAAGIPSRGGPIAVMLAEHEEGRRLTRGMRQAAERMKEGEASARAEVARDALGYVALLRQHILKEEGILFPMAERIIQGEERERLAEGFERVEREETGEGVHARYLALAERLEREGRG
jgi:hemerythrin-like domain-containing protein